MYIVKYQLVSYSIRLQSAMTVIWGFSKSFIQFINLFSVARGRNGNPTYFLNSVLSHATLGVTCCAGSLRLSVTCLGNPSESLQEPLKRVEEGVSAQTFILGLSQLPELYGVLIRIISILNSPSKSIKHPEDFN